MSKQFKSVEDYAVAIFPKLSKRAKTVVKEIIENGSVTTERLADLGYEHAPRAVRDVREAGIPITTLRVLSTKTHRKIASYVFGDIESIQYFKSEGRRTFTKAFKEELFNKQSGKCAICNMEFDEKLLQIDHRIPYEYMGDARSLTPKIDDFMLLCGECNKKKDQATIEGCSKTCFLTKDIKIIRSCYWSSPENYTHICMKPIRRMEITWFGNEDVSDYDEINEQALHQNKTVQEIVKHIIHESRD